jgi:RNA polymerase-binding transcription factor DksA
MRGPNKLTRSERREIEAALTSEIERMDRAVGPFAFQDEASEPSAWSETAVSDGGATVSPAALVQRDGRYYALTEALRRLDAGTYGACAYCGNSIPSGRLLVIPETDHCLGCGGVS